MTDIKTMPTEELREHVDSLYRRWMYHEAAERGYDYVAASAASREHSEANAELELRRCRTLSKPFCDLIGLLVGGSKA